MEYAVEGDNWQPTEINVGDISLYLAQTDQQTLRVGPGDVMHAFACYIPCARSESTSIGCDCMHAR
jgi:hypothetical protein